MYENNKNVGVIVEQGFVAGQGLGFNTVDLNENKNNTNDKEAE